MANQRTILTPPGTFHQFLELPLADLMVPGISKYLKLKDIYNFRCCSRYCKELAESALAARRYLKISAQWSSHRVLFRVIIEHCRNLREIHLIKLFWITDKMLIPVFNNNPHLEVVVLYYCRSFTPKALYPLAENCKNLTSLKVTNGACDDRFLEMLNQNEIQLEQVVLWRTEGFSKRGLCSFFRKQPRLKHIRLPRMWSRFRETLETIAESCQELRYLCIEELYFYNDYRDFKQDLKWFLKASPKLEMIGINEKENIPPNLWDDYLRDLR